MSKESSKVYLLTSDGYRDSLNLDYTAIDEDGIKQVLIKERALFGEDVIEESIKINFESNTITYQYYDFDGEIEDSKYYMISIPVI